MDLQPLKSQAVGILGTGQCLCTSANNIQEIEAFLRNGEI